jgi:phosphoenolpyruvate-protein kinase (PTS system EI component)
MITSAGTAHIDVGLCGEMAADTRCALLLIGMGCAVCR